MLRKPEASSQIWEQMKKEKPTKKRRVWIPRGSRLNSKLFGGEILYVLRKELTNHDIKTSKSPVFINTKRMNGILIPAMTEKEISLVNDRNKGLSLVAVDLVGQQYEVIIKRWNIDRPSIQIKNWKDLVQKNGLKEGNSICMCFHRHRDNELCLTIEAVT